MSRFMLQEHNQSIAPAFGAENSKIDVPGVGRIREDMIISLPLALFPLSLRNPNPKGFAMKGSRSKPDTRKADNKLSVKRKPAATERAGKKPAKKEKAVKDPNKPKRPASAFFVFMEEFRKQYKEKHPNNKSVSVVGKAGGDKWKSLTEAEKAPYQAKADKRKNEYNKSMQAYNKKQAEGANAADDEEDESDKSKSEVNDDDEDESGEEEDDDE
ncbi:hypothetical protein NE237_016591 [Protea cynaroides]|uniref:HMG box domain-containing protein n=1 Tax=Protea cynaroides TaxID=273540 RepID=A0A9Q0K6G4_9MAGN|nr:hypothetical protein NE237_016591 [Protea cynaroides]